MDKNHFMKIIYIAHPIGGDVAGNLEKIRLIVRELNLQNSQIVPFAPYWLDCHALDDTVLEERIRGIRNGEVWLKRRLVDEVWLYGERISNGMYGEILMAHHHDIPVVPMTEQTKQAYKELLSVYAPA